ncbi:Uncharacterized protein SCF082_LOCUS674 [Durusdinium trenchii]|uniref:Uncharacterized protein n=1 Tax=Durusdinium trenchii TaxID=1381693 RepID=A0ABP0H9K3_9DINO
MGKRRGHVKEVSRGGLPQGCLDIQEPCPDGSYPTGTTLQREDYVYRPINDLAPAGCYSGCAALQSKFQPKFTLFDWQSSKREATPSMLSGRSCATVTDTSEVPRLTGAPPERGAGALRSAGSQALQTPRLSMESTTSHVSQSARDAELRRLVLSSLAQRR